MTYVSDDSCDVDILGETTIHGRLNDEELGRSRLGVARIEEEGQR